MAAAHADICLALGYGAVWLEKKDGTGAAGGCADNCSVQGSGVGWLGKRRLGWRWGYWRGCGF